MMNSLRIARAAARVRPVAAPHLPLHRRGYADAVADKIKLTLALPHQVNHLACCFSTYSCSRSRALANLCAIQSIYKSTNVFVHTVLVLRWTMIPDLETLTDVKTQRSSQYRGRIWGDGHPGEPRPVDRAIEARTG